MANTGKQSPLGINVIGSLMQDQGFRIEPTAQSYMGICKLTDTDDYQPGTIVKDTCLKWLTYAINDAYKRGAASQTNPLSPSGSYTLDASTYNNLITIGKTTIPALGNSPPSTWKTDDPSGVWINDHTDFYTTDQAGAPANSGYPFYSWDMPINEVGSGGPTIAQRHELAYKNEGQLASWYPYLATNSGQVVANRAITRWGWIRCIALQAWNEYNWNGKTATGAPKYKDFSFSFRVSHGFMDSTNSAIYPANESQNFLEGMFSNQDDLISSDVLGVCLASRDFGQDLINLGNAIDFTLIKKFGLPSALLQILQKNNALTESVVLALLTVGLPQNEITDIADGAVTATKDQEKLIYSAMLVITGTDLKDILLTLNCSTKTVEFLSDLLNVRKMFPLSYQALTVPIYNTKPGPTNSKTYYLIFLGNDMNPQLTAPPVQESVGPITPAAAPPITTQGASAQESPESINEKAVAEINQSKGIKSIFDLIGKNKNLLSSVPVSPTPPKVENENEGSDNRWHRLRGYLERREGIRGSRWSRK